MNESDTRHFSLPDGRILSYSDIGTGENGTWIHCHGIPGSRYELSHLNDDLCATGLRIIVADRPGYGDSTPSPDYDFAQHTSDLCQLADHLGLERFAVSGFSGGGVFALGTANYLATRIERLVIVATPAVPLMENPFEQASELTANSWRAALENPDTLAGDLEALTGSINALSEALLGSVGKSDRRYLTSERVYPVFMASLRTALEQGPTTAAAALARDTALTVNDWGIETLPQGLPVRLLHGTEDQLIHLPHHTALANDLPYPDCRIISDTGHYGLLERIWE